MNKQMKEQARRDILNNLRAAYPEGHMPLQDAADKIGIAQRRLPAYGVVGFRFKKGKRCRVELVAEAMAEHQGL